MPQRRTVQEVNQTLRHACNQCVASAVRCIDAASVKPDDRSNSRRYVANTAHATAIALTLSVASHLADPSRRHRPLIQPPPNAPLCRRNVACEGRPLSQRLSSSGPLLGGVGSANFGRVRHAEGVSMESVATRRHALVFVQPSVQDRWEVVLEDGIKAHQFSERSLALNYAKMWASVNRP